jgi:hypothetical protein
VLQWRQVIIFQILTVRAVPDGDGMIDIALGIRYAVDNGAKQRKFGKAFHHTDNGCMML